jgi:hypothetical protein
MITTALIAAAALLAPASPGSIGAGISPGPVCPSWTLTTMPGHSYAMTENGTWGADYEDPGGAEAINTGSGWEHLGLRAEPVTQRFAGVKPGNPAWLTFGAPADLPPPVAGTEGLVPQGHRITVTLHVPPDATPGWYAVDIVAYETSGGSGGGAQLGATVAAPAFWRVGQAGPAPASIRRNAETCSRPDPPPPTTWTVINGKRVAMGTAVPVPGSTRIVTIPPSTGAGNPLAASPKATAAPVPSARPDPPAAAQAADSGPSGRDWSFIAPACLLLLVAAGSITRRRRGRG